MIKPVGGPYPVPNVFSEKVNPIYKSVSK